MQPKQGSHCRRLTVLTLGLLLLGSHAVGLCGQWILPHEVPAPADNVPTEPRIQLGRMLFFDTRLSRCRRWAHCSHRMSRTCLSPCCRSACDR